MIEATARTIKLAIAIFAIASLARSQGFKPVTGQPENGAAAVYYDILTDGRVVKVDFLTAVGELVGTLSWEGDTPPVVLGGLVDPDREIVALLIRDRVGYPLDSGGPNILWSALPRFGVPIGHDRAVRRRLDRDSLLNEAVEQLAAAA